MKDNSPIHVAFLWHMHQPLYKDPVDGRYPLPWVRLHGTKDYYDMVHILERYPSIHQTVNIVPSLLEQLIDYTEGRAKDRFLDVTTKPADILTLDDKRFLLDKFFFANWENMIMPFPRYWELLKKRGLHSYNGNFSEAIRYYAVQDFLDLQVLFNLAWIDPLLRDDDDFLKGLEKKGQYFTEDEKSRLIEKQYDILKIIIHEYRKMQDLGIIELSTSPYYHPILPLLCDTDSARDAMPWVVLPNSRFVHPEDAMEQIAKGIRYHENVFGKKPAGMWPPEGGVSEDAVSLIARHGINWIATDERILEQSLGKHIRRDDNNRCLDPHILYKPYKMLKGGNEIAMVFRDRILSDLIGFVYSKWDAGKAADDLVERLLYIRESLGSEIEGHLVTIVLDGENAWEYYKNDGNDFLNALYSKISSNNLIKCVTIGE
ncbi:MAG: glycoside hydrolase [Deltaproteobacteria bacterium]|nr:glycoside hydrolase [Deltaproteobacteria bacterium]